VIVKEHYGIQAFAAEGTLGLVSSDLGGGKDQGQPHRARHVPWALRFFGRRHALNRHNQRCGVCSQHNVVKLPCIHRQAVPVICMSRLVALGSLKARNNKRDLDLAVSWAEQKATGRHGEERYYTTVQQTTCCVLERVGNDHGHVSDEDDIAWPTTYRYPTYPVRLFPPLGGVQVLLSMVYKDVIHHDLDMLDVTREEDIPIHFSRRIIAWDESVLSHVVRIVLTHHHMCRPFTRASENAPGISRQLLRALGLMHQNGLVCREVRCRDMPWRVVQPLRVRWYTGYRAVLERLQRRQRLQPCQMRQRRKVQRCYFRQHWKGDRLRACFLRVPSPRRCGATRRCCSVVFVSVDPALSYKPCGAAALGDAHDAHLPGYVGQVRKPCQELWVGAR
jgi:hypothetical protein